MNERHRSMVNELLAIAVILDDGAMSSDERNFVQGLDQRKEALTVGLVHILEEIWAKVFGG